MTSDKRQAWKDAATDELRNGIRSGEVDRATFEAFLRGLRHNGYPEFAITHVDLRSYRDFAELAPEAVT